MITRKTNICLPFHCYREGHRSVGQTSFILGQRKKWPPVKMTNTNLRTLSKICENKFHLIAIRKALLQVIRMRWLNCAPRINEAFSNIFLFHFILVDSVSGLSFATYWIKLSCNLAISSWNCSSVDHHNVFCFMAWFNRIRCKRGIH